MVVVQDGLARGEVSCELSQVEAGDGFDFVVNFFFQAVACQLLDDVQVLSVVKQNKVLLPELLGVNWTPSQLSAVNLLSQLVDAAENLLVFSEELIKRSEQFVNVLINPVSVEKLVDNARAVNIAQVLLAHLVVLEVVE